MLQHVYQTLLSRSHPRLFIAESLFFKKYTDLSAEIYRRALLHTQYADPKNMLELQNKRLSNLIKRVKKSVPFYREYLRDINSLDDFAKLAPITKKQMREESEKDTLVDNSLDRFKIPQWTSGSTGIPLNFFLDANMLAMRAAVYRRMLDWTRKTDGDLVIRLMPREHPGLENEGIFYTCGSPQNLEEKFADIIELFKDKPVVLQTRASHLLHLARLIKEGGDKPKLKALISYTEELRPEIRQYIESALGAPVFDYYASNEITAIAQECARHDGFHVNSEWVYLEILNDKNYSVAPEKIGHVVVTSLHNEVMPFIKYKLGDLAHWVKDSCPCGRTLPRIKIMGRDMYTFLLPNDRVGYFYEFIAPLAKKIDKIFQYQVVRESPEKFIINIIPTAYFLDTDKEEIITKLKEYLGQNVAIIIKLVKHIAGHPHANKHRSFINLKPDYYL